VPLGPVSTCWRTVRATLSPQKRQKQVWDKAVVCSALQLRRLGVSRWRERVARLVMVRGLAVVVVRERCGSCGSASSGPC